MSLKRRMVDLTVAAAAVETVYAPPATVLWQALHVQIPVASLWVVLLPQKEQSYLACCWTSNFLVCLLKDEPYLTPNLPVIPTFLVLLVLVVSFASIGFCFHYIWNIR